MPLKWKSTHSQLRLTQLKPDALIAAPYSGAGGDSEGVGSLWSAESEYHQQDATCARLLVMERQVSPWSMSLAVCLLQFGWRQCSGRRESYTDVAETRNPEFTFSGSESSATIHTRSPSTWDFGGGFPACVPSQSTSCSHSVVDSLSVHGNPP